MVLMANALLAAVRAAGPSCLSIAFAPGRGSTVVPPVRSLHGDLAVQRIEELVAIAVRLGAHTNLRTELHHQPPPPFGL
jgi:hypothetical protein